MQPFRFISIALTLLLGLNLSAQNRLNLLVGTYTNGTSRGIYSFAFDQATGLATPLDTLDLVNPSYLTVAKGGKVVYAVSEQNNAQASLSAITFDAATGRMRLLNTQPTHGEDPCHVATNGRIAITANYSGGSMSVFPIAADGRLLPMCQQFKGSTGGTFHPNQDAPHIHMARFTPDGKGVLATDFSNDRILSFALTSQQRLKAPRVAGRVTTGTAPRHMTFSRDRRFLYTLSECGGKVAVFKYGFGKARLVQEVPSDSVGGHGSADIHLSPDGRFLYASNRLKADGISIFSVDKKSGKIRKTGYQPTGIHPRNFNITPNGRYLLCACRDDNKIQVYAIDPSNGLLTDTHHDILVDKAVCVKFYSEPTQGHRPVYVNHMDNR